MKTFDARNPFLRVDMRLLQYLVSFPSRVG